MERVVSSTINIKDAKVEIRSESNVVDLVSNSNLIFHKNDNDLAYIEAFYNKPINDFFELPLFNSIREEEAEYYDSLSRTVNVVKSIYICPKCKYNIVIVVTKQENSGDESMTSRYKCMRCGHTWANCGK